MDELTARFQRSLRERLDALAADRAALPHEPEAGTRAREAAHALKGSGGTYGYPEITEAAALVEAAPDAALAARLDVLLAALRRATTEEPRDAGALLGESLGVPLAGLPQAPRTAPASPPVGTTGTPASPLQTAAAPAGGVLIVDDDPDITRLLARVLAARGPVHVAETAARASDILAQRPVALILLDLMLPDADGRALLARLRDDPRTAGIPIIVLSGHGLAETRAECFALGADGYVQKPFDPVALLGTVSEHVERAARFGRDARTDPVTGLPNRAAFREIFERAAARRASRPGPLAVALLELDQYRALEAGDGWASAERALAMAGQELARALAGAGTVARWMGATFGALLDGLGAAAATDALTAALKAVAGPSGGSRTPRLTLSAGLVEWVPGTPLDETLAGAQGQLAAARAAGGDTVRSAACQAAEPKVRHVVLLAEDDGLIASVIKYRLEREGITVEHFADGASAAAAAARLKPALAILDVKMPAMDGFELLGRLREDRSLAGLPVMMLTSMGSEQDVVRGLQLGADDYVVKPFSPVELMARVHRLLTRR